MNVTSRSGISSLGELLYLLLLALFILTSILNANFLAQTI